MLLTVEACILTQISPSKSCKSMIQGVLGLRLTAWVLAVEVKAPNPKGTKEPYTLNPK